MDMTKFESDDDPGFVAVVGELRRWIRDLSQSSVRDDSPIQGQRTHGATTLKQSGSGISEGDGRNTIENRANIANLAWRQTVYGGIHINQSV
jgi:hypothetical protein